MLRNADHLVDRKQIRYLVFARIPAAILFRWVESGIEESPIRHNVHVGPYAVGVQSVLALVAHVGNFQQGRKRYSLRNAEAIAGSQRAVVIRWTYGSGTKGLLRRACRLDLRERHTIQRRCFHIHRLIETLGELGVMVVILSPAATEDGLARAEQIVRHTEARSIVQGSVAETRQGHG